MADIRRQMRSTTVVLGSVGLLAAALTACSSDPDKRCVDKDSYTAGKGYRTVDGKYCRSSSTKSGVNGVWYYGGKKKGQRISGGSFSKPHSGSGSSGSTGGGVKRGGFGGKGGGSGS
ncbi:MULTISPECIES: hypothetical protein [unclassified Streptomyces]|uniref:hypothetical protein n=1 Tax=unclassified Streptomyces TaxID=2593676 RepID=UPI0004C1D14A|nr:MULTISPECIES: hypothetical protein [unclassified Streptomyces]